MFAHRQSGKLYVPVACQDAVAFSMHCARLAGHQGARRMEGRLRKLCWWPDMRKHCLEMARRCLICARQRLAPPCQQVSHLMVDKPFDVVACDFVGPLGVVGEIDRYIFTIMDLYTRYLVARIATGPSAKEATRLFTESWLIPHCVPMVILTDRGSAFVSSDWIRLMKQYVVTRWDLAAYTPTGNSRLERAHAVLKPMIDKAMTEVGASLDEALMTAVMAFNCIPNRETRETPAFLLTGVDEVITPLRNWDKGGLLRLPVLAMVRQRIE